jgi:hypothetical protein
MLASITPLGERGRDSHYAVTLSFFAGGAGAAGAGLGAALGGIGGAMLAGLSPAARLLILAAALVAAGALDLRARWNKGVPGPHRQVNERWLDRYRGWVYGLGFGAQLGLAVTTIVSSAVTYAALLAAWLSGGTLAGAAIMGSYGLIRGLTPLLAAGARTPQRLLALHERLERGRRAVEALAPVLVAAMVLVAVLGGAG